MSDQIRQAAISRQHNIVIHHDKVVNVKLVQGIPHHVESCKSPWVIAKGAQAIPGQALDCGQYVRDFGLLCAISIVADMKVDESAVDVLVLNIILEQLLQHGHTLHRSLLWRP